LRHTSRILLLCLILVLLAPGAAFAATAARVVLDPGHGGSDSGAIGVNGLQEKTVNLDIALKVRDELKKSGIEVIMTRETDRYLSLAERVAFTNKQNADLFVSVHSNWYENPAASGGLALYYDSAYPQASYPASPEMIALSPMSKALAQSVLSAYIESTGLIDRGLMESAVYVVRMGTIPSMLIETAFLSNAHDAALLADEATRSRMAKGIAKGIETYIGTPFPDSIGHWARASIIRMNQTGWLAGYKNRFEPDRPITRAEFVSLMDRVFPFDKLQPIDPQTGGGQAGSPEATASPAPGASPAPASGAASTPPQETAFKDLKQSHWAYKQIVKAAQLGILKGYPDGSVRPEAPITRGETAYLFDMLMRQSQKNGKPAAAKDSFRFVDVPDSLWNANAVYELRAKGIIAGYTPTEFKPDLSMTRAEMAVVLDRYASRNAPKTN